MTAPPFNVLAPVKKATSSIVRRRGNTVSSHTAKYSKHGDDAEDDNTKSGAAPLHPDVAMERSYYFDQWLRGRENEYYYKEGKTTFPGKRNWGWPTPTVEEVEKAPDCYPKSIESDNNNGPLKAKTPTNLISRQGNHGKKETSISDAQSDTNMSPTSGLPLDLVFEEEETEQECNSLYNLPTCSTSPTASNNAIGGSSAASAPISIPKQSRRSSVLCGSDDTAITEASVVSDQTFLSCRSDLGHTTKTKLQCDFSAYPDPDFIAPEQIDKNDKASYFLRMAMGGTQARLVRDEMERREELENSPKMKRMRHNAKERWRGAIGKVMGRKVEEDVKVAPGVLMTVPPIPGLFPTCQYEVLQAIDGDENGRGRCNYSGPPVISPRRMAELENGASAASPDKREFSSPFCPGLRSPFNTGTQ